MILALSDMVVAPDEESILLDVRKKLRRKRDFETADYIRNRLKEIGIEVRDVATIND
jgi:cysteinyl-tRNA synthetase